jgi:hypothetical protein
LFAAIRVLSEGAVLTGPTCYPKLKNLESEGSTCISSGKAPSLMCSEKRDAIAYLAKAEEACSLPERLFARATKLACGEI